MGGFRVVGVTMEHLGGEVEGNSRYTYRCQLALVTGFHLCPVRADDLLRFGLGLLHAIHTRLRYTRTWRGKKEKKTSDIFVSIEQQIGAPYDDDHCQNKPYQTNQHVPHARLFVRWHF